MSDEKNISLSDEELRSIRKKHGGHVNDLLLRIQHLDRRDKLRDDRPNYVTMESLTNDAGARTNDVVKRATRFRRPISDDEKQNWAIGNDFLLLNYQEALDANDLELVHQIEHEATRRLFLSTFGANNLDPDPSKWPAAVRKQFGRE